MAEQPSATNPVRRWIDARAEFNAAKDKYNAARDALWIARVRLADAHRRACEFMPDHEHMFVWFDELYGDRDQILAAVRARGDANG